MPLTTRTMPSFSGVGANQTASVRLPLGRTYHQLLLTYSGATLAQLNEARVVANGDVIQTWRELSFLDKINQFEGRAAANGVIVLDFDRYGMKTRQAKEFTAIGTGVEDDPQKLTTLHLEVDIDAAAVGPALSLRAVQSNPQVLGLVKRVRTYNYAPSAAGDFEISDLPKGNLIHRIIFDKADINSVKVERDNFVVFERTEAENTLIQNDGVRNAQSGYFCYDPTEQGYGGEGLVTQGVQDLRITVNVGSAGPMPVTVESIGAVEI